MSSFGNLLQLQWLHRKVLAILCACAMVWMAVPLTAAPSFPVTTLTYHGQGGNVNVAGLVMPQISPDGRFMCELLVIGTRGVTMYCWRLAPPGSSDPGAQRTGLLDSTGASIRATIAWAGSTISVRTFCFSTAGDAIIVSTQGPSRLYRWDRSVDTGLLTNPRVIFTLDTNPSLFANLMDGVQMSSETNVVVASAKTVLHRFFLNQTTASGLPTHEVIAASDRRTPGFLMTQIVLTKDRQCTYVSAMNSAASLLPDCYH